MMASVGLDGAPEDNIAGGRGREPAERRPACGGAREA